MKKRIMVIAVVLCSIVLLLAGCVDYFPVTVRGGGWLPYYGSLEPQENDVWSEGRTTFGFTVECYNAVFEDEMWTYDVRGNLTYIDHNEKMKIKGAILDAISFEEGGLFTGEYTNEGITGTFLVYVYDGGELGADDIFAIRIESGDYAGYENGGPLSGGNIQLFP